MSRIIAIVCFLLFSILLGWAFPGGVPAVLMLYFGVAIVVTILRLYDTDTDFLIKIYIAALFLRVVFGFVIHSFDLYGFFGPDAFTYDAAGYRLYQIWYEGAPTADAWSQRVLDMSISGWGMNYLVGVIYSLTGRNMLAAQLFCVSIGAATAPIVYVCAYKIFGNRHVAKNSAIMVAVFPAFVIWSSQLLKDGLIIFLLVLVITMILQLQERLNYAYVAILVLALLGILTLRFYIFYMVVVAVVGSFVIGSTSSRQSIFKRVTAILVIGISLTYLGALQNTTETIDQYANLERIQRSRKDLIQSAESGFGGDIDVSTTEGALTALPIGFAYLMFAPFPWQVSSVRQAIALPEVLLWWAMMPLLISGLIYTFKHRLRNTIAILLFTVMLTIGYSIFQGNVGTAYRQRTQIQIFFYMFIAAGWTLRKERKEIDKLKVTISKQRIRQKLANSQ